MEAPKKMHAQAKKKSGKAEEVRPIATALMQVVAVCGEGGGSEGRTTRHAHEPWRHTAALQLRICFFFGSILKYVYFFLYQDK